MFISIFKSRLEDEFITVDVDAVLVSRFCVKFQIEINRVVGNRVTKNSAVDYERVQSLVVAYCRRALDLRE